MDADFYMRPWKIYKPAMDAIKSEAESDPEWIEKAAANHELLTRMLKPLGVQEKILSKPVKALWTGARNFISITSHTFRCIVVR